MELVDLVQRRIPPEPWGEGEKIPWDDPAFSERMLAEHLSQRHDRASRRPEVVAQQVAWLAELLPPEPQARMIDLCCGPGLYTAALARLGHRCTGIDFSPASIRYARERAAEEGLDCTYREADVRDGHYGTEYALAVLIFGELNSFREDAATRILEETRAALAPGGAFVVEAHRYEAVRESGRQPPTWYSSSGGLFCPDPHLVLREAFWDEASSVATRRYYAIDTETARVSRYAESAQAYTDDQLGALLTSAGFEIERRLEALPGTPEGQRPQFAVWVARK